MDTTDVNEGMIMIWERLVRGHMMTHNGEGYDEAGWSVKKQDFARHKRG